MNTWLRRTVGTVGIAGGLLLLGAGAAHADDTALAPGQLDDLFSPAGGPNNQSLQLQGHTDRIDTSTESTTRSGQRTTSTSTSLGTNRVNRQAMTGMLPGLPLSSLVPTDSLGLPRTTSSRVPNLPALPTDAVAGSALPGGGGGAPAVADTEDALSTLPLVGGLANLSQLGLPGTDTLQSTSIADTSTAFPSTTGGRPAPRKAPRVRPKTEGLPLVGGLPVAGGLPLLGGGLPVRGTLRPADDFAVPVGGALPGTGRGATEAGGLPLVGDLPLGGSDVLKNDAVTGVPVVGGVGPTPGVSTSAVANRLVPTTGALPQAASSLPLVTESSDASSYAASSYAPRHAESSYAPRHGQTEALPLVTGLPVVGGVAQGVLPFFSGIAG